MSTGHDTKRSAAKRENNKTDAAGRDITLSEHDAESGAPADSSVAGEEDPGAGLEALVKREPKGHEQND